MDLNLRIENRDDRELVYFNGQINEDAEVVLGNLKAKLGSQCIFNFKDIKSINSCGVRAWINFMRDIEAGRRIAFEECPPEVVSQINMIPNFKGKAEIRSVYASYSCENCDHQKWQLFEKGKNLPQKLVSELPQVRCPKCQEVMEMEELEDEFFGWLDAT